MFTPNPSRVRSKSDVMANANAALFAGYDEARHAGKDASTLYDTWKGHASMFANKSIVDVFKGVAVILENVAPVTREAWRKLAAEYYYNVEMKQKPAASTTLAKGQKFVPSVSSSSTPWWVWPSVGVGSLILVGGLIWMLGGKKDHAS